MLPILFFLSAFLGTVDLSEVGGLHLSSSVTAHQKTYLFYRVGSRSFDFYIFDWTTKKCVSVPKDGRVELILIAYLFPTQAGVAILCTANRKVFLLSQSGEFQDVIGLRQEMEDGEWPTFGAPGPGNSFYLTTTRDEHSFYSQFDLEKKTREILFRTASKGFYYILPFQDQHIVIKHGGGEIRLLDNAFQPISEHPASFESVKSLSGRKYRYVGDPVLAGDNLTLVYSVKNKSGQLSGSARFSGKQLLFSAYRTLGVSPDGSLKMVYSYQDDEINIVPADFTFAEARIPPMPEDKWPPEP